MTHELRQAQDQMAAAVIMLDAAKGLLAAAARGYPKDGVSSTPATLDVCARDIRNVRRHLDAVVQAERNA